MCAFLLSICWQFVQAFISEVLCYSNILITYTIHLFLRKALECITDNPL